MSDWVRAVLEGWRYCARCRAALPAGRRGCMIVLSVIGPAVYCPACSHPELEKTPQGGL